MLKIISLYPWIIASQIANSIRVLRKSAQWHYIENSAKANYRSGRSYKARHVCQQMCLQLRNLLIQAEFWKKTYWLMTVWVLKLKNTSWCGKGKVYSIWREKISCLQLNMEEWCVCVCGRGYIATNDEDHLVFVKSMMDHTALLEYFERAFQKEHSRLESWSKLLVPSRQKSEIYSQHCKTVATV